jgi:hypothetical protein
MFLTPNFGIVYVILLQNLRKNVEFKYDWSYIISWIGVGLALLSAILFRYITLHYNYKAHFSKHLLSPIILFSSLSFFSFTAWHFFCSFTNYSHVNQQFSVVLYVEGIFIFYVPETHIMYFTRCC